MLQLCIFVAAMFFLVYLNNDVLNPQRYQRICPRCSGRREHHPTCPLKQEED